jgi:two-component system sensor histidine kinase ChiS
MFLKLVELAQTREKHYGLQYYTFAIFGIINYPLAYIYELYTGDLKDGSHLRLISTLLCIILLYKNKIPEKFQKYLPLFWYITITISIPILTTFMLLEDNLSLGWLINFNIGVMIMILVVDSLSFLLLEFLGIALGILIFYITGHSINTLPSSEHIMLFLYMFLCIVILGSIFSRNKEIFNNYLQKAKDDLQAQLETLVSERTIELKQALAFKTEFLNNMSHEIRTPIQGVTNISEGLVTHWKEFDDNKKFELAQILSNNAKRLLSLVGNLLDLSKIKAGKMLLELRMFDLNDSILDIIDECKTLYINDKNIEIKFTFNSSNLVVADQERITQVLRNLLINAIKFSPASGKITVILTPCDLVYDDSKNVHAVQVTVTDEGVGIPSDESEIIFSPFEQSTRTKTKAGGTGLGLAICREIINAHYGRIWAQNNEDKGSSFSFIIPTTQSKLMEGHKIISENNISKSIIETSTPANILIIDDEDACLISMELLLFGTNYTLIKANGGFEGLRLLNENPTAVDLVLLDLMMPDMYGLNVLVEIKNCPILSKIPIILQSGTSDQSEIEKAYQLGITCYIKKPYQKQIIISEIHKALNKTHI